MTKFLPFFPLHIVAFPGENLNLHIFEARYKQLILECFEEKKHFGIPSLFKNKPLEYGTSIEILSIEKIHTNGEMDIKTKGIQVFKTLEHIEQIPDKLYSGGIVHFKEPNLYDTTQTIQKLILEIHTFHKLLKVEKKYSIPDEKLTTFDVAHHVGLSTEQEYQLLQLDTEVDRIDFISTHLKTILPTIIELEKLKERIQLNGHFRKLSIE